MSGRSKKFLLILILVTAVFFRFYDFKNTPPGLYGDEAMNGNNAKEAIATGDYEVFYEENNGREGLFINIQAVSIKTAEAVKGGPVNEPWILRLPSIIFGVLTVLGIYFLTRELFAAENVALLTSFLLATSFWHINFSRIGFRAIMAPFFLIWGTYLLLLSFRRENKWLPAIAGIIYGLGMHSYIAYRATPLFIIITLIFCGKIFGWKKSLRIGSIFAVAAIIVSLPLGIYFLNNPGDFLGRTSGISVFNSLTPLKDIGLNILKTAGMFNFAGDWNPRHNIPGEPLLFWPVGIFFILGLLYGLFNKKIPSRFAFWILFGWLIVTALPVLISNEGIPHALRAILMAPAVFIIAALGGVSLYEFLKTETNGRLLKTAAYLFFVFLILNAYQTYFLNWAKRPDVEGAFNAKYVKIAEEINALPAATIKYLVIDTGGHDVRKIGSPAQTVMFLTDTYLLERQKAKNIRFVNPSEILSIPSGSFTFQL